MSPSPDPEPTINPKLAAWNDPKRLRKATLGMSCGFYVLILFAILHPDSMPQSERLFGAAPLGLPLWFFMALLVTLVFAPLPFAFWHGYRIIFRAMSDGGRLSKLNMIRYLFTTANHHPDLRRSRVIVLTILFVYLASMFGWAYYEDEKDIGAKAQALTPKTEPR